MSISDNVTALVESFERGRDGLPGPALAAVRDAAIRDFAEAGFPTPRIESWKYTNLNRLARSGFDPLAEVGSVDAATWSSCFIDGACRLVIVNGRFDADASSMSDMPAGVTAAPFSTVAEEEGGQLADIAASDAGPLVALNTAFMRDGLVLTLGKGAVLEKPVQVVHIVDGGPVEMAVHPRTLVVALEGSQATIVETFVGGDAAGYWTNAVTEMRIAANASVRHFKRQSEGLSGYHTALTRVRLGRDARYAAVSLAIGAALSRNEIKVAFDGEGADCSLSGATLLRGRQHADSTTEADHKVPRTASRQVFRNVLDDRAHSVFQGGVIVRKDAQKTDSSQSNRNLLLSAGAQADTKPELRIFADDVKCAHGATVGDLDRDALFYLESRGIPPLDAKSLLIEAFVAEALDAVPEGAVRAHFTDAIADWMGGIDRESGS